MKQQEDDFGYKSTVNLGIFVCWCFDGSISQFLKDLGSMGSRWNGLRKQWYGCLAGELTIMLQEGHGRVWGKPGHVYEAGFSFYFLIAYWLFAFAQQFYQMKAFRNGWAIHSYSCGVPALARVLKRTSYRNLMRLEAFLVLILAAVCEWCNLPLSLWLLMSGISLYVRMFQDEQVSRLANADATDAAIDAGDVARAMRAQRPGVFNRKG